MIENAVTSVAVPDVDEIAQKCACGLREENGRWHIDDALFLRT